MKSVYVETSIISYLAARPSNNLLKSARQTVTNDWWENLRGQFELYVSTLVIDEISAGDPQAAARRLSAIQGVAILAIPDQAVDIADALLVAKALPEKAREDSLHIGIAATQGVDYLLTWNFKHINNAHKKAQVVEVVERFALACPALCSPEELGEIT
jgi:predicted nucleic acid-binding protein